MADCYLITPENTQVCPRRAQALWDRLDFNHPDTRNCQYDEAPPCPGLLYVPDPRPEYSNQLLRLRPRSAVLENSRPVIAVKVNGRWFWEVQGA